MNLFLLDLLSALAMISGVMVITSKSPVSSVLFLVSVFVNSACYLVILGVGFIGLSYLIVYVGAIAILFLFVIMMLNLRLVELVEIGKSYTKNLPLGLLIGLVLFLDLVSVIPFDFTNVTFTNKLLGYYTNIQNVFLSGDFGGLNNETVYQTFNLNGLDNEIVSFTHIQAIGQGLYTYGSIWLILVSFVLLLGMVGPIVLCLKPSSK